MPLFCSPAHFRLQLGSRPRFNRSVKTLSNSAVDNYMYMLEKCAESHWTDSLAAWSLLIPTYTGLLLKGQQYVTCFEDCSLSFGLISSICSSADHQRQSDPGDDPPEKRSGTAGLPREFRGCSGRGGALRVRLAGRPETGQPFGRDLQSLCGHAIT